MPSQAELFFLTWHPSLNVFLFYTQTLVLLRFIKAVLYDWQWGHKKTKGYDCHISQSGDLVGEGQESSDASWHFQETTVMANLRNKLLSCHRDEHVLCVHMCIHLYDFEVRVDCWGFQCETSVCSGTWTCVCAKRDSAVTHKNFNCACLSKGQPGKKQILNISQHFHSTNEHPHSPWNFYQPEATGSSALQMCLFPLL